MDPPRSTTPTASSRIPRARGDGPAHLDAFARLAGDSPRSRGWTQHHHHRPDPDPGFPALAGMDPPRPSPATRCGGIPRARGDGPRFVTLRHWCETDSPRSRGWTAVRDRRRQAKEGFPALAGMDPEIDSAANRCTGIPRARGDGPARRRRRELPRRDSPRSRGWTVPVFSNQTDVGGFPALAGMDPSMRCSHRTWPGIPRARGDGPGLPPCGQPPPKDSPRSRGWTRWPALGTALGWGFPALAGMDPRPGRRRPGAAGIPRARGDGPHR